MHKKAFTLIEMLIVIVIIGILAAALVPRLQAVQGRARDTKRKADIAQIHTALIVAYNDNGMYPTANGLTAGYVYSAGGTNPWIITLSGYMTTIPIDPINNTASPVMWSVAGEANYTYVYGNLYKNQKTFMLFAKFENRTDRDRCELNPVWFHVAGTNYSCTDLVSCGPLCPYLYMRTDVGP